MQDGSKDARFKKVFEIIYFAQAPPTDYQVLQSFKPGSDNLNLVQPRISEGYLMDQPVFEEGPPGKSNYKNTPVRTTIIARAQDESQQFTLF